MTMVMPRYWMDFGLTVGGSLEDIHHSYRSRIWQGEMYGHAMHAMEMGQDWRCPVMTSATVSGNSVVVNFDSLEPLVIDPTFCKVRPDMGFTIGNGAVVTGVRLTGQRQVTVDCATAPATSISYAYRSQDGSDVSDRWPIATGAIRDAWQADSRYLGHNWSWRPYFYHLLAEGWEERRLTLSSTYRDATTNQYCLTAGQFFDNGQRLLLIDIDAAGL